VPENKDPRITRMSVTMIAGYMPYSTNVARVIMLANPSLNHGIGAGNKLSIPWIPNANAESRAMRYLSRNCINSPVVVFMTAYCDNNFIRKAYHSAGFDPTLPDAELVPAGRINDTNLFSPDLHNCLSFRTFNGDSFIFVEG